ncbi:MAG: endonuclease/exonuclease/phosphatase family protein [Rhodothermales bacterium]|nr:endonuclease/exonuclease/phosphatase family protein [Rhodothermales bacterium]
MKYVLIGLAIFFVIATVLPLIRHDHWWIRIFDFPRGQIALGGVVILAVYLLVWDTSSLFEDVLFVVLLSAVVFQGIQMFPYTPFYPNEVVAADEAPPDSCISLLVANVLMSNRESGNLLDLVEEYQPDVILTVETDAWWEKQLRALETEYPHTLKNPLDNTYGMLLHSRLELIEPEIRYLVKDSIPSMHAGIRLPSGIAVQFHGIHPEPPFPKYADDTTERDAELLLVGKEVEEEDRPTIVAGDLNDVAWSYTTSLFQKISGLLDPRKGRGMYNTFHAENGLMRWPLDHVFHSDHFKLVRLERGPAWGSDHFPVFIQLCLDPSAEYEQEEPEADRNDEEEADKKIEKAATEQDS